MHPTRLETIAKRFQIDRTLWFAMSARAWQAISGPLTIVFLVRALTLGEQGVYYVLASVMSIQLFFELGLLNVLISQSGHLASDIASNRPHAKQRMSQLISVAGRWFLGASMLYALAAIGFGWRTLVDKASSDDWKTPLVCLSIVAAGSVALAPRLAILEGAGYRASVYKVRFFQMLLGTLAVWSTLLMGFKLWALVFSSFVQFLCSFLATFVFYRAFFDSLTNANGNREPNATVEEESGLKWFSEVFPLQWRVALTSMAYHIATQFFTVILVWHHGEEAAGRLGMTMSIVVAIQGMAITFIQTKFSLVSNLHGAGDREGAGELWRRSALISSGLLVTALLSVLAVVWLLPMAGRGWEDRFIEPWQIVILAVGCLANHGVALQSFYVLSRKGRPFLAACLVGFGATAIFVWFGGARWGATGIVTGYALGMLGVTLPLHSLSYWLYRAKK
ncbi:MAG: hypothetical protein MUC43_05735 [Pirellula sp.]|nr:hypothetical protein [Pirellula sp.]